jgi:hypothetical protein
VRAGARAICWRNQKGARAACVMCAMVKKITSIMLVFA